MTNIVRVLTFIDKSGGEINREIRNSIEFSYLNKNGMA